MDLPPYLRSPNVENYNEELNRTLRDGLSNNGFTIPVLTAVDINTLEPSMPIGTLWFNKDAGKLMIKVAGGITETVQSI